MNNGFFCRRQMGPIWCGKFDDYHLFFELDLLATSLSDKKVTDICDYPIACWVNWPWYRYSRIPWLILFTFLVKPSLASFFLVFPSRKTPPRAKLFLLKYSIAISCAPMACGLAVPYESKYYRSCVDQQYQRGHFFVTPTIQRSYGLVGAPFNLAQYTWFRDHQCTRHHKYSLFLQFAWNQWLRWGDTMWPPLKNKSPLRVGTWRVGQMRFLQIFIPPIRFFNKTLVPSPPPDIFLFFWGLSCPERIADNLPIIHVV